MRSPLRSGWEWSRATHWWDRYRAGGESPVMVAGLDRGRYRSDGSTVKFTDLITSERTGAKPAWLVNGDIGWAGHNLVLNSAAAVTQSVTVVSGEDYTVECTGSGSIALTGAGTGTATDGTSVSITASTTTLTLTVTGLVDTLWAYRSGNGGMQPNGDLPATPTYFPTTSAAYYAPAIAYDPVTLDREGVVVEGRDLTRLNGILAGDSVAVTIALIYPVAMLYTGTGEDLNADGTAIAGLTEVALANGQSRLQGYYTATATATVAFATTATSPQIFIGGAGEKLPHTPIIGGDGSAVTVVKDVLTFDAGAEPFAGFDGTQGTFVVKGDFTESASTEYFLAGDAATRFMYQSSVGHIRSYDGTGTATAASVFTDNTPIAMVQSYLAGGNLNLLADGGTEGSVALTGDLASTTIDIGHLGGAAGHHGVMYELLYYDVQLALATMRTILIPATIPVSSFASSFDGNFL